jgi:hypothetical protein
LWKMLIGNRVCSERDDGFCYHHKSQASPTNALRRLQAFVHHTHKVGNSRSACCCIIPTEQVDGAALGRLQQSLVSTVKFADASSL